MSAAREEPLWWSLCKWAIGFTTNLPVCGIFGSLVCSEIGGGADGILIGIAVLFALGAVGHWLWPARMRPLILGSAAMMCFQAFPFPQFLAGHLAIGIVRALDPAYQFELFSEEVRETAIPPRIASQFTFLVTLLTGAFLGLAAYGIGLILTQLMRGTWIEAWLRMSPEPE